MLELDNTAFAEKIKSPSPVVVDFWAAWCMPCKIFAPVLQEVANELEGQVEFCKLNIDENLSIAQEYAIESIPTVIMFKDGKAIERFVGITPKDTVLETLKKHL